MPAPVTLDLSVKIQTLLSSRRTHESAIADIDRVLDAVGKLLGGKPAGKVVAKPAAARSKLQRGTFAISGKQSILDFVKRAGSPTTSEINANWNAEGRRGPANNKLGGLVAAGKLKRSKIRGGKGSRYTLVGAAVARPAAVKPARRGKRGKFAMTGTVSVLKFIKEKRNPTAA